MKSILRQFICTILDVCRFHKFPPQYRRKSAMCFTPHTSCILRHDNFVTKVFYLNRRFENEICENSPPCIGPVAKTDNVAMAMASRNLRAIRPPWERGNVFCFCLGNQRSAAFAMSFIFLYGDTRHLVGNQARLQEVAEMTKSQQIEN